MVYWIFAHFISKSDLIRAQIPKLVIYEICNFHPILMGFFLPLAEISNVKKKELTGICIMNLEAKLKIRWAIIGSWDI